MANVCENFNHIETHNQELSMRLTNKRQLILSSLIKSGKALSAYEIIEFCNAEFNYTLHPMTVYRALDFFRGRDLVHKLNSINKYIACAPNVKGHEHDIIQFLICKKCDKIDEVNIQKSTLDDLHHNVLHAGFHFVSSQLEMTCICKSCHEKSLLTHEKIIK
jgi:Fur family zinc uptake transcriptional regulator